MKRLLPVAYLETVLKLARSFKLFWFLTMLWLYNRFKNNFLNKNMP